MTSVNVDQLLGMVIAPGAPAVATDQVLALLVEQRLQPQVIFTRCDQLLALIVERRGPSGSLAVNPSTVLGNGIAQATVTATVVNSQGVPLSGIPVNLTQNGRSVLSATSGITNNNGTVTFTATDTHVELVTYTASGVPFGNTAQVQFTASRVDGTVYNPVGPVVSGARIYACSQPATTTTIPPTPLLEIYADPNGQLPITQPLLSDGLGEYAFYADSTLFTLVVLGNSSQNVYADQEAGKPSATNHRLDWWVKSNLGPAIPGAQIFIVGNNYPNVPMTLQKGPPAPLVRVFSDPNGLFPIIQPLISDGFGFQNCYAPAGIYTVLVYLNSTLQQTYSDQTLGGVSTGLMVRYDGWFRTSQGVAVPNARITVCTQPCSVPGALVPGFPSNLANIFNDANGFVPITQSLSYDANGNPILQTLTTDANGHYAFYSTPNIPLTVSIYSQNKLQASFSDQVL